MSARQQLAWVLHCGSLAGVIIFWSLTNAVKLFSKNIKSYQYGDVTWSLCCFKLRSARLFVRQAIIFKEISERRISDTMWGAQSFIQAQIIENIKAPRYWPLCGEFTGDPQKWPVTRKCFHLMTSWFFPKFSSLSTRKVKGKLFMKTKYYWVLFTDD